MTDLIIHVGPGKCGSTSIQSFFKNQKRPCVQKTHFEIVDPGLISRLNRENPSEAELVKIEKTLSGHLNRCESIILSHEYFFDCPHTVLNICNIAKNKFSKIFIIGYCRRQSDFSVSVYSQWLFRSPERVMEVTSVLTDMGVEPVLFSGLERQLIAAIATDFHSIRQPSGEYILDWYESYQGLSELVSSTGAVVFCGQLPRKGVEKSLVQDFCEKAGLTLDSQIATLGEKVANVSYHPDLIEAINNAVLLGLKVPGAHECNEQLELISAKMTRGEETETEFISELKKYIDTYFFPSNIRLCEKYNLCIEDFSCSGQLSKQEILDRIKREAQERAADRCAVIKRFRMLSARTATACLELTKRHSPSSRIDKLFKHRG